MTGASDDGQAGVTEADRETAGRLATAVGTAAVLSCEDESRSIEAHRASVALIAAALAAERVQAREPFLALARHWERKESTDPIAIVVATLAANEIRRAAEEQ